MQGLVINNESKNYIDNTNKKTSCFKEIAIPGNDTSNCPCLGLN
jgi:hypothetical protein